MAAKLAFSVALLAFLFSRIDAAQLWATAKNASPRWLLVALALYFVTALAGTWRWQLLLEAQHVSLGLTGLLRTFLVANFFSNFLPSNIGGDVFRIRETAGPAGSKTLATTIVLVDRGLGLMALILIAALGSTVAAGLHTMGPSPLWATWLWAIFFASAAVGAPAVYAPHGVGRLLQPLKIVHAEWVGARIETLTVALGRFRDRPGAIVACFAGAVAVQALTVIFYVAAAHALRIPITGWDLAVIVPMSLVVQMAPVSVNGLGLREATFSFYFTRLGLPIESAVLLSLVAAGLSMFASLSGAAIYVSRGR